MFYQDLSPQMKKYVQWLGFLLLVGLVLSTFSFAWSYLISAKRASRDISGLRQISVSGEGKVTIKPDIAVFNAGVVTESKKIGDAQQENTRRSNAVLAFLKGKEVKEKDLKTVGYTIFPQYQYFDVPPCYAAPCPPRRPPEITSYQVRHTIEIKARNLDIVDSLLEGVVINGANEVGSVSFTVEDEEAAREEARKKAIEHARSKAKILAHDLGMRLGDMVSFSEGGSPVPLYARGLEAYGKGGDSVGGFAPEVAPGEQEIQSFVTITYEFR